MTARDPFTSAFPNAWCPGCGNHAILTSLQQALTAQQLRPQDVVLFSGIGQAAKTPHYLACNYFHGLHGRALPAATGAKLANHDLHIVVTTGDGDCYGEGGNHFLNAIRRNIDITLLVHNNKIYGLTKGQASPTSDRAMITRAQPHGVAAEPFNPLLVALALNIGFVARGFAGNPEQLTALITAGMQHPGFSLIDILQPCVSFNHTNTYQWYNERVYDVRETEHDILDFGAALTLAREWGDRIPTGILYAHTSPTYEQRLGLAGSTPLARRTYSPAALRTVMQSC